MQGPRELHQAPGLVPGLHRHAEQQRGLRDALLGDAERETNQIPSRREKRGLGDVDVRRGVARAGDPAEELHGGRT